MTNTRPDRGIPRSKTRGFEADTTETTRQVRGEHAADTTGHARSKKKDPGAHKKDPGALLALVSLVNAVSTNSTTGCMQQTGQEAEVYIYTPHPLLYTNP